MVEQANYTVQKKLDDIEFREYPEILLATVSGMHDDSSFDILFNYIAGSNRASKKISMTAPVVSSKKIPMTAPVISNDRFFTFVLPSSYSVETVPKPTDGRINIHVQPPKIFAVLRFNGKASEGQIAKMGAKLLETLARHNVKTRGDVFLMRYNSPFAPGFMRRNEVGIEVLE
jgi:hypothetical protein